MAKGTVKWFNEAKGYGFITPDEKESDLYFERSNIDTASQMLIDGQRVEFEIFEGLHGEEAKHIHPA
jgi:cold shock protein